MYSGYLPLQEYDFSHSISTKSAISCTNDRMFMGRTQPLILRTQNSAVPSSKIEPRLGHTSRTSPFRSVTTIEQMSTLPQIFYFEFQSLPHKISIFDSPLPTSMLTTQSYGISTSSTAYGSEALRTRASR